MIQCVKTKTKTNVLIVEDDEAICKALSMGLFLENSNVDLARDGNSALTLGKEKSYDVLVADIGLPDMDGFAVIREMKGLFPDIIPIVITGNRSLENSIQAIRLNVNDYLLKPIDLDHFAQVINHGLEKRALVQREKEQRLHEMLALYQEKITSMPGENLPAPFKNSNVPSFNSLGMLVHQINNPLSAIRANAEMAVLRLNDKTAVEKYLKKIINATEDINLINQRIIATETPVDFECESFNLKDILLNSLILFEPLFDLKKVKLQIEWTKFDCMVSGNRFGIEQVVNNLILNALEALDPLLEKPPTITARVNVTKSMVKLEILDNGTGIA